MTINQAQWCFAYPADRPIASGADRAALLNGARWALGSTITISFLEGSRRLQERVEEAAKIWIEDLARLRFEFRDDTKATQIRISFSHPGSWSVLGTTCKQITDLNRPTMNFGWLTDNSTDDDVRQVVLHEFGHALGLIHEHQSPSGGVVWNKQAVYDELSKSSNSWSKEMIDRNMFEPYAAADTNFTQLDPTSIMMYPIPARWTANGFSTGINKALSTADKQHIKKIYP